ncbi:MAG TPA: hypothetical protein VGI23_06595 [Steroidobacteraceae bacterium]|jgi:hypothetical protein
MSVASRPVSTGKTRTCPHCKATILESLSICPGCMHHLRFDSEAAKRQVAAAPALRVEGIIRHPPNEQPLEYFVIIAIRNDRGEEVTRQVVNVGALQAAEKRTFTMSVEVLPPSAPVPPQKQNSSTGTFKTPAVPSPPPQPAPAQAKPVAPRAAATPSAPAAPGPPRAAGTPNAPKAPPPGSAGAGSQANKTVLPANPAAPASPNKPESGYVLKPPSPGGPKRH